MADIEKGIPVRTEDDADEKIQAKIVDPNNPSQQAEVDADSNLNVEMNGDDPSGSEQRVRTSEQGHISVDGIQDGTNNSDPSNIGMIAHARNATPSDSDQTERVTSVTNGNGDVRAQDISLHDEAGEPYGASNPLPVSFEESEGTEVQDFNEAVDVAAAGGTATHEYSVADGDTFLLEQVLADASSRFRLLLEIGDGASTESFERKAVRFKKESGDKADLVLTRAIKVVGTSNTTTIRVTVQNDDDDDAQSIYTTIVGLTKQ